MLKLIFSIILLLLSIGLYFKIGKTDFNKLKENHPYWPIFVLLFLLMFYPIAENTLSNSCDADIKDLGQFLFDYKDYFGTIISIMLATIVYISENEKKNK